jgi:hypothetical protein
VLDFTIARNGNSQVAFAEGNITGMRGERGAGFHRLILKVRLHINPAPDSAPGSRPALTGLVADMFNGGVCLGRFTGHPWRWGGVEAPSVQAQSQELYLECDMDRARLEAVEALRAGGDLQLHIQIQAQVDDGRWQGDTANHTVNQSAWRTVSKKPGTAGRC